MNPVQVTAQLEEYMEALLPQRDSVLSRIEKENESEGLSIIGPLEGTLLYLLSKLHGAKQIVELGAAVGYSGIWLLRGSQAGNLVTFERNPQLAQRARNNFDEAGFGSQATVIAGDAQIELEKIDSKFDLCFIDLLNSFESEEKTEKVFSLCINRLNPGGLLLADNALRKGEVVNPTSQQARNVVHYNKLVSSNPNLEGLVMPIRDGVSAALLHV